MKKISKDLVVSFIIFYLYLVIIKSTDSVVSTLIVSISGAVMFSLFSLIIGSFSKRILWNEQKWFKRTNP